MVNPEAVCPKCGSIDVEVNHKITKDSEGDYIFVYKCRVCGHTGRNVEFWK